MIFQQLFKQPKPAIGMVHIQALPGTPSNKYPVTDIIKMACHEAMIYQQSGIDAVLIENMHDVPYLKGKAGSEITSVMSIIGYEIKRQTGLPVGIQILAGANQEALSVAHAAGLDFIRAEGFVYGHLADEGFMESCAGELLRFRKTIGAEHIAIFTDIKKKHSSHQITRDVSIVETAQTAEFFLSDGIIITGSSTGHEASVEETKMVKQSIKLPVIIGSGITLENVSNYFPYADAFIVGSSFKQQGKWDCDLDKSAIVNFMESIRNLRKNLNQT